MRAGRRTINRAFRLLLIVAAVAMTTVVVVGCGSSGGSSSPSGDSAGSSSADAKAFEAKWIKGTFARPKLSPVKPSPGKDVWLITIGQNDEPAQRFTGQYLELAKRLGWRVHLFDGKFEQARWLEGIRSAIAANAEAIVTWAIDCAPIAAALKEAKAAHIPVINLQGTDCDAEGGEQLFAYSVPYAPGNLNAEEWGSTVGEAQASWVAAQEPDAKILALVETDARVVAVAGQTFAKSIEKYCPDCEIVNTIEFVGTELGPKLQDKVEQALLQNPDITTINGNYDTPIVTSVQPAVRNVGSTQPSVIGNEGQKPNIEMIYNGEEAAGAAGDNNFEAFASVDTTIRILNGEKPLGDTGNGTQLYDRERNLPKKGDYFVSTVHYQSAYEHAWGLK